VLYVCAHCGRWSDQVVVRDDLRICPECGHGRRFRQVALFAVSGASGTGKTAIGNELAAALPEHVVLDKDVLWKQEYEESPKALEAFRRTWLRIAMNIAQGGRSSVLIGTVLPEHYESQPERRFFSDIHYLALVCRNDELEARLRARPAWRGWDDEKVERMLTFNTWVIQNAAATTPPMAVLDTTNDSVETSVRAVVRWVRSTSGTAADGL
jgi:broad-specificity NMP kinase/DNA-directed RNA polymerase subunit RPC12/RpoP